MHVTVIGAGAGCACCAQSRNLWNPEQASPDNTKQSSPTSPGRSTSFSSSVLYLPTAAQFCFWASIRHHGSIREGDKRQDPLQPRVGLPVLNTYVCVLLPRRLRSFDQSYIRIGIADYQRPLRLFLLLLLSLRCFNNLTQGFPEE